MYKKIIFWGLVLLFAACSGQQKDKAAERIGVDLPLDSVLTIKVKADTTQTYVLYLPPQYSDDGSFPVIFAFDSQGEGGKVVKWLLPAARRYGYVIAGSMNFKNRVGNLDYILSSLMNDLFSRLKVNTNRLYAVGFSGGGRVAATLAAEDTRFRGVLSMSAGVDFTMIRNKNLCAAATAGLGDFNYWEVVKNSPQFAQNAQVPFWYAVFDGGHEYPPQQFARLSLLWFEANAMKKGIEPKNKSLIKEIKQVWDTIIDTSKTIGQQVWAYQSAGKFLQGLKSTRKYQKHLSKLVESGQYKQYLAEQNRIYGMEVYLQQQYFQALKSKNLAWWNNEISVLNKKIQQEKDPLYRGMYKRLKAFISIVCFSLSRDMIQKGFYDEARRIVEIYQLDDPQNPDVYFYWACLYANSNEQDSARWAIKKAFELGFNNYRRLQDYQCQTKIQGLDDILKKVKK